MNGQVMKECLVLEAKDLVYLIYDFHAFHIYDFRICKKFVFH